LPANTNQALAIIRLQPGKIDYKYLFYFLKSDAIQKKSLQKIVGVGRANLSLANIGEFEINLAPLNEQTRIVAEIEKQFSRLDEAVANLKRVKANLKRYKAAVLKAAVEGKLTEEWRKTHVGAGLKPAPTEPIEPADKLLERILAERRKAAGKGKYKEPVGPDTSELPELPAGWVWASVEQIADVASGNTPTGILSAVKAAGDVPWYKVGDMNHEQNQQVMRHADSWLSSSEARRLGLRLFQPNTVLFPKRGGAIATNKKRRLESAGCADLNVMGITPTDEIAAYFFEWFNGVDLGGLSDGSNVPQINHKDIEPLSVPLPPLPEQRQIVAEVERRLSIVAGAEAQVDANLRRADRLRQSILKQAFSGQLVPQDPNDESASVLLERIRATQLAQTKEPAAHQRMQRTPAPKTGASSPEPLPLVADAPATYGDAIIARILAAMQPGREYARAEFVDPLGLTTGQWNAAIQELKRVGKVRQVGAKRGTKYELIYSKMEIRPK